MRVQLRSVEFWRDVRGPGPRNQSDVSSTFSTTKAKPGEANVQMETGLSIIWDQEAHAVYLVNDKLNVDPVVIYAASEVRRGIPVDGIAFLLSLDEAPAAKHKGK